MSLVMGFCENIMGISIISSPSLQGQRVHLGTLTFTGTTVINFYSEAIAIAA